jgi:hypothetical protein
VTCIISLNVLDDGYGDSRNLKKNTIKAEESRSSTATPETVKQCETNEELESSLIKKLELIDL